MEITRLFFTSALSKFVMGSIPITSVKLQWKEHAFLVISKIRKEQLIDILINVSL